MGTLIRLLDILQERDVLDLNKIRNHCLYDDTLISSSISLHFTVTDQMVLQKLCFLSLHDEWIVYKCCDLYFVMSEFASLEYEVDEGWHKLVKSDVLFFCRKLVCSSLIILPIFVGVFNKKDKLLWLIIVISSNEIADMYMIYSLDLLDNSSNVYPHWSIRPKTVLDNRRLYWNSDIKSCILVQLLSELRTDFSGALWDIMDDLCLLNSKIETLDFEKHINFDISWGNFLMIYANSSMLDLYSVSFLVLPISLQDSSEYQNLTDFISNLLPPKSTSTSNLSNTSDKLIQRVSFNRDKLVTNKRTTKRFRFNGNQEI